MSTHEPTSDLLLTSDAARLAGVSSGTIRHWTRTGRLAVAVETPGRVKLVRAGDVMRIANARDRKGASR